MRYFFWAFACLGILSAGCTAFGVTAPAVMAAEVSAESPAASSIWLILAGEGTWGAVAMAVLSAVYALARPYLLRWMAARELEEFYLQAEVCAGSKHQTYVDAVKRNSTNGKLTEEQKKKALDECRADLIITMQDRGLDIVKKYGYKAIDIAIEWAVARTKAPSAVKAVAAPLPDLAP